MLESVQLNRASLVSNIQASQANQARAAQFYAMSYADLATVPTDTALSLINSLSQPTNHQASQGRLERLLDGGQLNLIED